VRVRSPGRKTCDYPSLETINQCNEDGQAKTGLKAVPSSDADIRRFMALPFPFRTLINDHRFPWVYLIINQMSSGGAFEGSRIGETGFRR